MKVTKVNMHEAKTHLSKLLEKAMNGEEVVIAKAGKAMVKLVPIKSPDNDWWGMDAGKIRIADDFDEFPADLMAAFYGEDEDENPD